MTIILSSAGLILLVFGGFFSWQNSAIDRRLDELRKSVVGNEHALNDLRPTVAERGKEVYRLDQDIRRIDARLLHLEDGIVTRGEHREKWASIDAANTSVQRQIDEMRKELGSSYTLGDKIKELQRQLDDIRNHQPPKL